MAPPTVLSTSNSSIASLNSLPLSPSASSPLSANSPSSATGSNIHSTSSPRSSDNAAAGVTAAPSEEDMTEDEVALMVKNALRKARKAMSDNVDCDDDDDRSEESSASTVDFNDGGSSSDNNHGSASSLDRSGRIKDGENDGDLARRIEQEIMGARAFAEKVYYGNNNNKKNSGGNAETLNINSPGSGYEEENPHDEEPIRNSVTQSSVVVQQRPPMSPPKSKARSAVEQPQRQQQQQRVMAPPSNNDGENTQNNNAQGSKLPPSHVNGSSPTSINRTSTNANAPASSKRDTTTVANSTSSIPRQHRQVVFRHPYPLPPPPILPRSDSAIISTHQVHHKNTSFKSVQPDDDLAALIHAAESTDSLVRRSNACGALKVLASKESNRAKMCRTAGLLTALIAACKDDAIDSDALDARTRAVTTILYLSELKDNRLIVCRHENMLSTLMKVIQEDTGEARLRACCCLAVLGKTPVNRGWICSVEGLCDVLSGLMVEGAVKDEIETTNKKEEGKIERKDTTESRDDSTMRDDMTASYNSEEDDGRLLSNTYSGTFSNGTGTFSYEDEEEGSLLSDEDEEDDGYSSGGYSDGESVQEEEGVEMQISSLKKLNIENHGDFLARSQLSACATLTHLTKHCANAPLLAQDTKMLENLLILAPIFDNPLHTRCIEIICNLTRFPSNNARLASNPKVVETLLLCGKSKTPEDRLWAIRTIQNLCSDAGSKVTLATCPILSMLSTSAMRKDYDEQYAAVAALMNLSTEPGSIVPLTNTKTVVATLVHLAHSPNTPAQVRKIACDSLATIGLWLQTLASAGTVPEEIPFSPLPTHSATGWLRWES